jgi:hypothetical protein
MLFATGPLQPQIEESLYSPNIDITTIKRMDLSFVKTDQHKRTINTNKVKCSELYFLLVKYTRTAVAIPKEEIGL